MTGRVRGRGAAFAAALLAAGLLAGCSGDDGGDEQGAAEPSASASASETTAAEPTLAVPAGVELTPQGSQFAVDQSATVAYEVKQGVVGVLDITVTRLEQTTIKKSFEGWDLDKGQRRSTPYFVRATVTNVGETDLGGRRVPLYIVDADNTLVESTSFASAFTACEPGAFPESFPTGAKTKVCLVYLAPEAGVLTAVSFRPTQEFDPITWTGELQEPKPPKKKRKGKGGQPSATPTP